MAANRLSARLASANLSPEQLCAFIGELAPLLGDAALRVAEAHVARLVQQPEWVLSEVLLSPDLVPHILAQLPTKAHAAKGTCRAWRRGWKQTLKKRERPRLLVIGGLGNAGRLISSVALDGKLYAVGGCNNGGGHLSSVEPYDPTLDAWEAVAPMASARSAAGVAVLDGKLYAVGGFNGGQISSLVERYDPATNAWEEVAPMAEVRCAHAAAVLDGKLYAVGALGPNADLSSVERYDPAVGAWQAGWHRWRWRGPLLSRS